MFSVAVAISAIADVATVRDGHAETSIHPADDPGRRRRTVRAMTLDNDDAESFGPLPARHGRTWRHPSEQCADRPAWVGEPAVAAGAGIATIAVAATHVALRADLALIAALVGIGQVGAAAAGRRRRHGPGGRLPHMAALGVLAAVVAIDQVASWGVAAVELVDATLSGFVLASSPSRLRVPPASP
jgi:hypothetical protein